MNRVQHLQKKSGFFCRSSTWPEVYKMNVLEIWYLRVLLQFEFEYLLLIFYRVVIFILQVVPWRPARASSTTSPSTAPEAGATWSRRTLSWSPAIASSRAAWRSRTPAPPLPKSASKSAWPPTPGAGAGARPSPTQARGRSATCPTRVRGGHVWSRTRTSKSTNLSVSAHYITTNITSYWPSLIAITSFVYSHGEIFPKVRRSIHWSHTIWQWVLLIEHTVDYWTEENSLFFHDYRETVHSSFFFIVHDI
jgi:hypothetical protein